MKILGIDPGTTRIGYAIITDGSRPALIEAGLLTITTRDQAGRLIEAAQHLRAILKKHAPDAAVFEKLFFAKNQKTAIPVAEMRGALILCVAETGIPIEELAPSQIKSSVAGYGSADKRAMGKMVQLTFNLPKPLSPDDISDAVAIALAGAGILRFKMG